MNFINKQGIVKVSELNKRALGDDGWTGAVIGTIAGGIVGNIKGKEAE